MRTLRCLQLPAACVRLCARQCREALRDVFLCADIYHPAQVSKEDGVLQPPEKMAAEIGAYLEKRGFLHGK